MRLARERRSEGRIMARARTSTAPSEGAAGAVVVEREKAADPLDELPQFRIVALVLYLARRGRVVAIGLHPGD